MFRAHPTLRSETASQAVLSTSPDAPVNAQERVFSALFARERGEKQTSRGI
jgi:hypothetical protein